MYRKVCTKAAACAMGIMMAGGISAATKEESIRNVVASSPYYRYVTASALIIRTGASTSYSRVGTYLRGTKVACYGTSGNWTKVKYSGKTRYVCSDYLSSTSPDSNTSAYSRYVTASSLNVRSGASTSSSVVGTYREGTKVTCYGTSGSWTKVKYNGVTRYVSTQYLSASAPSSGSSGSSSSSSNAATNSSSKGQQVANYALQFVGNPYVWGGTSLTNGSDCSGFTQSVYKHFGYSIPRTSASQRSAGKAVSWSERQVGDLICYSGHVAIYIGNNKIVHSSNPKDGVKITSPANYTTVLAVRRIVD